MNENDQQGVVSALAAYFDALHQLYSGNLDPMRRLWLDSPEVTNLGRLGGLQTGYERVQAQYARESQFGFAGLVRAEGVYVQVSGDFGYTVCDEVAEEFGGTRKPIPVRSRATHIFQRHGEVWRLIHHHADLSPAPEQPSR